jgi:DNA end-binding protein Ku
MPSEARSIASLTISFGLVAIPVRLYSATVSSERISFNLLHKHDGSRLRQQYVCIADGKVVPREEMVKGYEFAKDQYVIFSPEEIKALEEVGSDTIEIEDFVPLESVDPVFFDRTYYLAPDKGGAKPYTLLTTALSDSKRCAVGRWAARGKEHIIIVRPMGKGLALHQLHFKAEVRTIAELAIEAAEVKEAELKLARLLIDQQSSKAFDPNQYVDEVKQRIEEAIAQKVKGNEVSLSAAPEPGKSNVIDLMEALKASLKQRSASVNVASRKAPKRVEKVAAAPRKAKSSRK